MRQTSLPNLFLTDSPKIFFPTIFATKEAMVIAKR